MGFQSYRRSRASQQDRAEVRDQKGRKRRTPTSKLDREFEQKETKVRFGGTPRVRAEEPSLSAAVGKVTTALPFAKCRRRNSPVLRSSIFRNPTLMNSKKFFLLSCAALCILPVSPAMAQMRGHSAPMPVMSS